MGGLKIMTLKWIPIREDISFEISYCSGFGHTWDTQNKKILWSDFFDPVADHIDKLLM